MKLLLAVLVIVCAADAVRGQAAGVTCGANDACDENLVCQDSKCRVKLGGPCTSNADNCVLTAKTCDGSTCECISGATVATNKEMCECTDTKTVIKSDGSSCVLKVGETCGSNLPNCLENGVCTDGKCACNANFGSNADKSKCLKNDGQTCMTQSECLTGAECSSDGNGKMCKCPNGANTEKNKCLAKVDETCNAVGDCIANTECSSEKCKCKSNYLATYDMKECRKAPDQSCDKNDDCGQNAECNQDKKCACKTGFNNKDGERCGKKVGVSCDTNMNCVPNAECKEDASDGNKKKCTCKEGYDNDSSNFCSGAATAMISLLLMLAAFVVTRWV